MTRFKTKCCTSKSIHQVFVISILIIAVFCMSVRKKNAKLRKHEMRYMKDGWTRGFIRGLLTSLYNNSCTLSVSAQNNATVAIANEMRYIKIGWTCGFINGILTSLNNNTFILSVSAQNGTMVARHTKYGKWRREEPVDLTTCYWLVSLFQTKNKIFSTVIKYYVWQVQDMTFNKN